MAACEDEDDFIVKRFITRLVPSLIFHIILSDFLIHYSLHFYPCFEEPIKFECARFYLTLSWITLPSTFPVLLCNKDEGILDWGLD